MPSAQDLGILVNLLCAGFLSNIAHGITVSPSPSDSARISEAEQRIWAGLKYCYNDRPVLSHISFTSMPSRCIFMNLGETRRVCSWWRAWMIRPFGMEEIVMFRMKKKHERLDARVALPLGILGEAIAGHSECCYTVGAPCEGDVLVDGAMSGRSGGMPKNPRAVITGVGQLMHLKHEVFHERNIYQGFDILAAPRIKPIWNCNQPRFCFWTL
ncbi:hypothetical protein EDD17DRAFT_1671281, partial [Pisolithus thermaeus]